MKKRLIISIIMIFTSVYGISETADFAEVDSTIYDSGNSDVANAVAVDNDGNIIVTGYSVVNTSNDFFTVKYDSDFNVLSSATYNGGNNDVVNDIAVDKDNNIIVTGLSHNGSDSDYYTIKYNYELDVIVSTSFDSGNSDYANSVAVDNYGNIIVTGEKDNGTNSDFFTIKYDCSLNVLSSATYNRGMDSNDDDSAKSVAVDNDGNIIVSGRSYNGSDYDIYTIKYDSDFNILSSTTYDSGSVDYIGEVETDEYGNIILATYIDEGDATYVNDWKIIKYNSDLENILSNTIYDSGNDDRVRAVSIDDSGNIICAGYIDSSNRNYHVIKYDSYLNKLYSATYDGGQHDYGFGVAVDDSGYIIVTGKSNNGSDDDYLTLKYSDKKPEISSVSPFTAEQGETLDVMITGVEFYEGASVEFCGSGISTASVNIMDTARIEATISIAEDAEVGKSSVTVISPNGRTDTLNEAFKIIYSTPGSPDISSISPLSARQGETVDLVITGSDFDADASVEFEGEGISIKSMDVADSSKINASIDVSENASAGKRDVTVENSDGSDAKADDGFEVKGVDLGSTGDVRVQGGENGYVNPEKGEQARINFRAEASGKVEIKIYDLTGRLIWSAEKNTDGENDYIKWACENSGGSVVATDMYIIYIKGPGIEERRRIAIVK
ncbi:MAG: hypothetical protein ACOC5R_02745 [Elusimicrobiota bacterium]